jgi:hypothetical protein
MRGDEVPSMRPVRKFTREYVVWYLLHLHTSIFDYNRQKVWCTHILILFYE